MEQRGEAQSWLTDDISLQDSEALGIDATAIRKLNAECCRIIDEQVASQSQKCTRAPKQGYPGTGQVGELNRGTLVNMVRKEGR